MTRTPTDMETAMSDKEAAEELANGLSALFSLVGADADIQIRDPEEAAAMMQCYAACAAINPDNPVVVAEALPELVEAADGIEKLRFFIKVKAESSKRPFYIWQRSKTQLHP